MVILNRKIPPGHYVGSRKLGKIYLVKNLSRGFHRGEYHGEPKDVYDRVARLRNRCSGYGSSGLIWDCLHMCKTGDLLRLPAGLKAKLEDARLTGVTWKEVSFSGENKNYKIVDGFLCSQDGKTIYRLFEKKKTTIPDGTETISKRCFGTNADSGKCYED